MIYYSTTVTGIGAEVPDLLDGGVLILYADRPPPSARRDFGPASCGRRRPDAGATRWRVDLRRRPVDARQRGGVDGLEQGARVGPCGAELQWRSSGRAARRDLRRAVRPDGGAPPDALRQHDTNH